MCCTLDTIKATTKMQVDTSILLLFYCLFCVHGMRIISMFIVKEIILPV